MNLESLRYLLRFKPKKKTDKVLINTEKTRNYPKKLDFVNDQNFDH